VLDSILHDVFCSSGDEEKREEGEERKQREE
jgi:hypothetical protein